MTPHEGIAVMAFCSIVLTACVVYLIVQQRKGSAPKLPISPSENGRLRCDDMDSDPEPFRIDEPSPIE